MKWNQSSRQFGDSTARWGTLRENEILLFAEEFGFQQNDGAERRIEQEYKKTEGEWEREQFPQIECLSNKGYQILCEQNNNCALTVVTEWGPSGNKNCSQT